MGFEIDNNIIGKKVTLEQLTAGLDQVKDKKKIERIKQILNKYKILLMLWIWMNKLR